MYPYLSKEEASMKKEIRGHKIKIVAVKVGELPRGEGWKGVNGKKYSPWRGGTPKRGVGPLRKKGNLLGE